MHRLRTTRLGWLLLAFAALARADGDAPAPPAALEVPERVYDAGRIERGTVVQHAFTLRNRGATELGIDAKPG